MGAKPARAMPAGELAGAHGRRHLVGEERR
jgi:hypothetical protein